MRYTCFTMLLLFHGVIIFDSAAALNEKYENWIEELSDLQAEPPKADRLLSKFIAPELMQSPDSSFFELLSHTELKFYYMRDNSFIHSKRDNITVDILPLNDLINIRFRNHRLDGIPGNQLYGTALLDGGGFVVKTAWLNLDSDSDLEFICISMHGGSGPYYSGIIINPSHDMFSFRTFYSSGRPQIDEDRKIITLGKLKNGYQGTRTEFIYTDYVWNSGLKLSEPADRSE